jgi:hypothetical protein
MDVRLRPRATQAGLEARRKNYELRMLAAVLLIALGLFLALRVITGIKLRLQEMSRIVKE